MAAMTAMLHASLLAAVLLMPGVTHARLAGAGHHGGVAAVQTVIRHATSDTKKMIRTVHHLKARGHDSINASQPVPEHGYFGRKVEHANMESATGDWSYEYGPQPKGKHILAAAKDGRGCQEKAGKEKIATFSTAEDCNGHEHGQEHEHHATLKTLEHLRGQESKRAKDRVAKGRHEVESNVAKIDNKHHAVASSKEKDVATQARQKTEEKSFHMDRKEQAKASSRVQSDTSAGKKEHEVGSQQAYGVAKKADSDIDTKTARVSKKEIAEASANVRHGPSEEDASHRVVTKQKSGVAEKDNAVEDASHRVAAEQKSSIAEKGSAVDEKATHISKEQEPCSQETDATRRSNCEKERAKELAAKKVWEAAKNDLEEYNKGGSLPAESAESSARPQKTLQPAQSQAKSTEHQDTPELAEPRKSSKPSAPTLPEETDSSPEKLPSSESSVPAAEDAEATSKSEEKAASSMDSDSESNSKQARPAPAAEDKKEPGGAAAEAQSGTVERHLASLAILFVTTLPFM